ncbi:hypothetical protein ACWC5G_33065, partial [Streptomyces sp. NPDC001274]
MTKKTRVRVARIAAGAVIAAGASLTAAGVASAVGVNVAGLSAKAEVTGGGEDGDGECSPIDPRCNETGGNETGGNETGGNETGGNETGGNE